MSAAGVWRGVTAGPKVGAFSRRRGLYAPVKVVGALRAVRMGQILPMAFQEWAEGDAGEWALDAQRVMPAGCCRSHSSGGYWGAAIVVRGGE